MHNDQQSFTEIRPFGLGKPVWPVRFVRTMHGGSRASLVECSDGGYYIIKLAGNPAMPNLLANEFLGSAMAKAVGLPVARPRSVFMSADFLNSLTALNTASTRSSYSPQPGLHYASQMVARPVPHFVEEHITRCRAPYVRDLNAFLGMYILDVWAKHQDRRQALFVEEKLSRRIDVVFIDHGHMFGGPTWDFEKNESCQYNPAYRFYSRTWTQNGVNSWVKALRAKLPGALDICSARLPSWWFTGDLNALRSQLHHRLRSLPSLVEQAITHSAAQGTLHDELHLQNPGIRHLQPQG